MTTPFLSDIDMYYTVRWCEEIDCNCDYSLIWETGSNGPPSPFVTADQLQAFLRHSDPRLAGNSKTLLGVKVNDSEACLKCELTSLPPGIYPRLRVTFFNEEILHGDKPWRMTDLGAWQREHSGS